MQKQKILGRMFRITLFALLFGTTAAYAQSSKDASGMTQENKAGQMSPTGQNETTSASPPAGDTSGASTSGASAGATSQGASGTSDSAAGASKSGAGGKSLSKADQNLMRDMTYSNLAEIEAGKIALSQSKNDQVRSFAQKMIDDHTQAQKDLEQLAQAKGVTLPTEPDKKHKAAAKKLSALEGDKFDKQYMSQGGVRDHRDTHKLLDRAQNRAADPDLKALAAKMVPVVNEHMTMAQDVNSAKSSASGSQGPAGTSSSGSDSSSGSSGKAGSSGVSGTPGSSNSTSPGKQ